MALSLALVGCGAMGSSLLEGWLTLSDTKTRFKTIWVVAPHEEKVAPFLVDPRVRWLPSPEALPESPEVVVFAVKPFLLEDILPLYTAFDSLIISVAAGKSLSFYEKIFSPSRPLIRAMPNIPVRIHEGVIGFLGNSSVGKAEKAIAEICFNGLGFCPWLKSDDEIDKVTAISGSGPAYVFYMIEALAQGAKALGFDKNTALNLALHTFWGASTYATQSKASPTDLRKQVTSPKGTTMAAINVLETGGLHNLVEGAVKAAYARARELGE